MCLGNGGKTSAYYSQREAFPLLTDYETKKEGGSKFTLVHFASSSTRWTRSSTSDISPESHLRRRENWNKVYDEFSTRCLRALPMIQRFWPIATRVRGRVSIMHVPHFTLLHILMENIQSFILPSWKSIRLGSEHFQVSLNNKLISSI